MDSQEGFGSLIPENIKKKLYNVGVQFSELRQASKTPENLIEDNIPFLARRKYSC